MSTAVPVRLDDDDIATLDELVRRGLASSRSDAIRRGIDRERRRLAALRDAEIYGREGEDEDLVAFGTAAATTELTELD